MNASAPVLVFQYGSNLSPDRLNGPDRLDGRARAVGPVVTTGRYELDFTVWSETNRCAAADLIPGRGRPIWGVLYEIPVEGVFRDRCPPGQICLDAIESEGTNYLRTAIEVCGPDGTPLAPSVLTYLGRRRQTGIRTAEHYVRHILDGLRAHEIPRDYLTYVRRRIAENLGVSPSAVWRGHARDSP